MPVPTSLLCLLLMADPDSSRVDVARLIEHARQCTVQVMGEWRQGRRRSTRWGGGVIVGDRHAVLTCLHVIEGYRNITLRTHDDTEHAAKIVTVFPDRDLAVLEMVSERKYAGMSVRADRWKQGEPAIAVGFPVLNGRSIVIGRVGSIRRDVIYPSVTRDTPLLAFQGETGQGFSGGPLINIYGEFIGLVMARSDDDDGLALPGSEILSTLGVAQLPIPKQDVWVNKEPKRRDVAERTAPQGRPAIPPSSRAVETSGSNPIGMR